MEFTCSETQDMSLYDEEEQFSVGTSAQESQLHFNVSQR